MKRFDAIVIGGGAAGLFCASVAGQRGLRVAVIDHADVLGEKIRISGGGRCNFTNINTTSENFISRNPHFARSALARFKADDFVALVRQHRIAYHEKTLGQLFCDRSAQDIIDLLLDRAASAGVQLIHPARVLGIRRDDSFCIDTSAGIFAADQLVVATGGLSVPATGATALGYKIAEQFGVPVISPRPGLVPLAMHPEQLRHFEGLSGVSFDAIVRAQTVDAPRFRENVLLTHRGLSGPAILQASNYWHEGGLLEINLLPEISAETLVTEAAKNGRTLAQALGKHLPERFARAWALAFAPAGPVSAWTLREREKIAQRLRQWQISPAGSLGYKKAEVTLGGIDTDALSSKTMECTGVPGLFFIGEVVDVAGWLGGYNFQWAWSSAFACGQALTKQR